MNKSLNDTSAYERLNDKTFIELENHIFFIYLLRNNKPFSHCLFSNYISYRVRLSCSLDFNKQDENRNKFYTES